MNKIYDSLSEKMQNFENSVGLSNIVLSTDALLIPGEALSFIDDYRQVIRNNDWFYDDEQEATYASFLDSWLDTHLFYFDNAKCFFKFPRSFSSDEFALAVRSETARGLVGKRSKIGLDSFLGNELVKLQKYVSLVTDDLEDDLGVLSSVITPPYISAENELYFDFSAYQGPEIDKDNLLDENERSGGLVAKLLREYCKYSIHDFNNKLRRFSFSEEGISRKKDCIAGMVAEKEVAFRSIYEELSRQNGAYAEEFKTSVDRVNELNYLNANLEAKFSFKGWPGLMHHLVFKDLLSRTNEPDIHRSVSKINSSEVLLCFREGSQIKEGQQV